MSDMQTDKVKVLAIEDAVPQALSLEEILTDKGFEVSLVSTPDEWRKRKDEFDPGVIILDIIMPVSKAESERTMGGFLAGVELHKELAGHFLEQGKPMPPIIVLTAIGGARREVYADAKRYFDELPEHERPVWIDKPPDVDVLLDCIGRLTAVESKK